MDDQVRSGDFRPLCRVSGSNVEGSLRTLFLSSVFAPAVRSMRTSPTFPALDASISGVSPFCGRESGGDSVPQRPFETVPTGGADNRGCHQACAHDVPGILLRPPLQQGPRAKRVAAAGRRVQRSALGAVHCVGAQPPLRQELGDQAVPAAPRGDVHHRVAVLIGGADVRAPVKQELDGLLRARAAGEEERSEPARVLRVNLRAGVQQRGGGLRVAAEGGEVKRRAFVLRGARGSPVRAGYLTMTTVEWSKRECVEQARERTSLRSSIDTLPVLSKAFTMSVWPEDAAACSAQPPVCNGGEPATGGTSTVPHSSLGTVKTRTALTEPGKRAFGYMHHTGTQQASDAGSGS